MGRDATTQGRRAMLENPNPVPLSVFGAGEGVEVEVDNKVLASFAGTTTLEVVGLLVPGETWEEELVPRKSRD